MGNVLKFPRKRRQSLAERAVELAKQRTTEQLQSELAVNLSDAFKTRREKMQRQREFNSSAGLAL